MDIKSRYEKLREKYGLPSYEELDEEFELLYFHNILEINYPLRFIRRRIMDKISAFVHFFQNILNPTPGNLIAMEENSFLTKDEKDEITSLVKNMIILERESLLLDINHDEEKDAEFIKKAASKWEKYRVKVGTYTNKLREGWNSKVKEEDKEEQYFG